MAQGEMLTENPFEYQGLSSKDRETLQRRKLRALVEFLNDRSVYWRQAFREAGFGGKTIGSPNELVDWPWMDKGRYLADMAEHHPYGRLLCEPLEDIKQAGAMVYHTTGTSGRQGHFINTVKGYQLYGADWARILTMAGLKPGDRFMPCFPFSLWAAGWGAVHSSILARFILIPGGAPIHNELRFELLTRYRPRVVVATPSFALHLGKLAEKEGFDLPGVGVERLLISGEVYAEARRRDIERYWGCPGGTRNLYGITEGGSMLGGTECEVQDGMHFFEDRAVHQVWDADSDEPKLAAPGQVGEYVFTALDQRSGVATWFNFRTRDGASYSDEPCPCGRPGRRIWIHDRLDDMRKIRGLNIFASGVETLIREIPTLSEEFQLVVTEDDIGSVTLTVRAEAPQNVDVATLTAEAEDLRRKLKTSFGARMEVEIVPYEELPRFELKAQRWLDLRGKDK